jgi:hypothetical protein
VVESGVVRASRCCGRTDFRCRDWRIRGLEVERIPSEVSQCVMVDVPVQVKFIEGYPPKREYLFSFTIYPRVQNSIFIHCII